MGKHPARYSTELLPYLAEEAWAGRNLAERRLRVVDPMAGTGERLRELYDTWSKWAAETGDVDRVLVSGIELEQWDNMDFGLVQLGNALDIRSYFEPESVDVYESSFTYANRYADHHDNRDTKECKRCEGSGSVMASITIDGLHESVTPHPCPACEGAGRVLSTRRGYQHNLGRKLHPENTGQMQWGPDYKRLHLHVICDIYDTLVPGGRFVLNISDHIRAGKVVRVSDWFADRCEEIGFSLSRRRYISTKRDRGTGNAADRRVDAEQILTFVKPVPRAKKAAAA